MKFTVFAKVVYDTYNQKVHQEVDAADADHAADKFMNSLSTAGDITRIEMRIVESSAIVRRNAYPTMKILPA